MLISLYFLITAIFSLCGGKSQTSFILPREFLDQKNVLTTADDFHDFDYPFFLQAFETNEKNRWKREASENDFEIYENISRVIEHIRQQGKYDKRIRPNYKGRPVKVAVSVFIGSISDISEVNMDITMDFYFRQYWHDHRLNFAEVWDEELVINGEFMRDIWRPDTFFVNTKHAIFHQVTSLNTFLRVAPCGDVTQSLRLTVTAACPMDLRYFPMDSQKCSLEIESFGYTTKDIKYRWVNLRRPSVGYAEAVHRLPQFRFLGHREISTEQKLSTGNYSRLIFELYFQRSLGYYLIQVYIPSSLIVIMSQLSFYIRRDSPPARVSLGITTVLTMSTLIASTNANLPKISYLKAIDIYLVSCFFMVFAALLEYAAVAYSGKHCTNPDDKRRTGCLYCKHLLERASVIEKYSRIFFPTAFLCFNVVYWISFANVNADVEEEGFIDAAEHD